MGILSWWRARVRFFGTCPACGHDWREHPGSVHIDTTVCSECIFEVQHDQRPAGSGPSCEERAPGPPCSQ